LIKDGDPIVIDAHPDKRTIDVLITPEELAKRKVGGEIEYLPTTIIMLLSTYQPLLSCYSFHHHDERETESDTVMPAACYLVATLHNMVVHMIDIFHRLLPPPTELAAAYPLIHCCL